jgi:uncharacterized membrane protein
VAFIDSVFAITITELAPDIQRPTGDRNLVHGLFAEPSNVVYAIRFPFIGDLWPDHHAMFDHIHVLGRLVLLLNALLLIVVALLPFGTPLLRGQRGPRVRFPSPTGSQLRC